MATFNPFVPVPTLFLGLNGSISLLFTLLIYLKSAINPSKGSFAGLNKMCFFKVSCSRTQCRHLNLVFFSEATKVNVKALANYTVLFQTDKPGGCVHGFYDNIDPGAQGR